MPDAIPISRRRLMTSAGKFALGAAASSVIPGCATVPPYTDASAVGETPLRERGLARSIPVGTAVRRNLLRDRDYSRAMAREFNILVPENELKWGSIEWVEGQPDYSKADAILRRAEANGQAFRGHTLIWHSQMPPWLEGALADKARDPADIVETHIRETAGRYAGRMHSWDVINEAFEPDHGRPDGLRETPFLKAMGTDYLAHAFRWAAQADPHALLVLNEYGLEWGWDQGRKRRKAMLALLEKLLGDGAPVHAVGIQGHLRTDIDGSFDGRALRGFCEDVTQMGLDIMVTELDARDPDHTKDIAIRDRAVADAYWAFLDVMLDQPRLKGVLVWGFTDRHSWLTNFIPRKDGDRVRGTLLDADYGRKPAWYAMAAALDRVASLAE